MKIGIISDTHISGRDRELPVELLGAFKGCDLILHAGDLVDMAVIDTLKEISEVEAVYGNMDSLKVRSKLRDKKILKVDEYLIQIR